MKPLIKLIFKLIYWLFVIVIGLIYSVTYFIYDPRALLVEKRKSLTYEGLGGRIDWRRTLKDINFWCPYVDS